MAAAAAVSVGRRSLSSCRPLFRKFFPHNNNVVQSLCLSTKIQPEDSTTTSPFKFPGLNIKKYPFESFPGLYIEKYQFSEEIAFKVDAISTCTENPQNPDLILSCLKEIGFSNALLQRIVRHYCLVLFECPETILKPNLNTFRDFGFSDAQVTQIIASRFSLLLDQPKWIIHSLSLYKRFLGSNDRVVKLTKKCINLLYPDPEKILLPNIEFLKNTCDIPHEQIISCIYTCPYLFLRLPGSLRTCVHMVDKLGVQRNSKMFIYAAQAVSWMSDEDLKHKVESFKDLGFSQDDILRLFGSYRVVIGLSTRKIKEVKEVLLETGKYDMSCIGRNPPSLLFSVEKRYKPRLHVLKTLERKALINKWPSLSTLCSMSDKRFFEKFVAPNINEFCEDFSRFFIAKAKTSLRGKVQVAGNQPENNSS